MANAAKHHDRENGRVVLRGSDREGTLRLQVEDDGPGIPSEQREQAFELFRTLVSCDVQEGSGMGLALVRRLLESFGGSIAIEAREGRGTCLQIEWPLEKRERTGARR